MGVVKREFEERDRWYFCVPDRYIAAHGFVHLRIRFWGRRPGF